MTNWSLPDHSLDTPILAPACLTISPGTFALGALTPKPLSALSGTRVTPTPRSRPHTSSPFPWRGSQGRRGDRGQCPVLWASLSTSVTIRCGADSRPHTPPNYARQEQWKRDLACSVPAQSQWALKSCRQPCSAPPYTSEMEAQRGEESWPTPHSREARPGPWISPVWLGLGIRALCVPASCRVQSLSRGSALNPEVTEQ